MRRYLVTGGGGFIGSHLVGALLDKPVDVIVADRSPRPASLPLRRGFERAAFIVIDLQDWDETAKLIADTRPDTIYHLAAQPLSVTSNVDPRGTVQDNVLATYSVLEGLRNHAPESRFVYSSSACFYGIPSAKPPLRETDAPAVGHYIYTATKIAADYAVQHYRHVYHLECVSGRMVNVYGPGDMHFERIVPRLIVQALRDEAPTLTQSDGSDVLSFLYVDDAVAALRLLGTHSNATKRSVWNISGSPPLSVLELMRRVYSRIGNPAKSFVATGPRRGAPVHKYLDGAAIRAELGFSPSFDLDHGLGLTIDWYKEYLRSSMSYQWEVGVAEA